MAWEDRSERIDHDSVRYLSEQLADDIAAMIKSGKLPPGSRLPAGLELARIYGVALVTVRRAIAILVERGLVVVARGRGTFVAES